MGANSSQLDGGHHQATENEIEILGEREKQIVIASKKNDSSKPKLPHNYKDIIKEADSSISEVSPEKILDRLHSGVFLNQKRKKYWVEKNKGLNCFMLYARNLSITWAEDKRYWNWPYAVETTSNDDEVMVDVAQLVSVCWLELQGKFNLSNLSPETTYEVVFVVMLKDPAYGWEVPVNVKLELPSGETQVHKVDLMRKPRADWIEIYVGEFKTCPPNNNGEVHFSMFEFEGGKWKRGLLVKGVIIRPKS
ncbi:hypothetical protein Scep_013480 [Stephania cephalantha]|uniref:Uncharacterized protein n=1 Tax=Stephania cephalantha TaxID=152367 RepID=A0AAP0JJE7_9MAGN